MFSFEICELFKNTYFEEHLQTVASDFSSLFTLQVLGNQAPQITQKVKDWIERCKEATEPHYTDVHKILYKVKAKNLGSKL